MSLLYFLFSGGCPDPIEDKDMFSLNFLALSAASFKILLIFPSETFILKIV
jgi:hypothetical protein